MIDTDFESTVNLSGDRRRASSGEASSPSSLHQLVDIGIVFSPVLMAIVLLRLIQVDNPMWLVAAVWVANVMMLFLIWMVIRLRGESLTSIGLIISRPSISDIGWAIVQSILIFLFAVAAFIGGSIIMANIVGIPAAADMSKYNYLRGNLPMLALSLAGSYLVASFGEEVVYRGFLITRLEKLFGERRGYSLLAAIVLSSIIFGLAHFEWGAMGIVQTTCMGAALGVSFLVVKRRLWPLILAHGYMDTILMLQLFFDHTTAA